MAPNPKKKILIALFRFPYPAIDGVRHRIMDSLIQGLINDYDLEFFVASREKIDKETLVYFEQKYGRVHHFRISKLNFWKNILFTSFSNLPFQARAFMNKEAGNWLENNISNYDAVFIHEIRLTEYFIDLKGFDKKKMVVDFTDAISLHYRSSLPLLNPIKKIPYLIEYKRVKKYEAKVLNTFDFFSVVSERDREYLIKLGTKVKEVNFSCIHLGMTLSPNQPQSTVAGTPQIFFIGNLKYAPNQDSVLFFLNKIWPSVKAKIPDLMFYVIGKGNLSSKYRNMKDVIFTGFVEDPTSIVKNSVALVAPIRFGGGTPSKILDAMAAGIPVITSREAEGGISGLQNGENIIINELQDALGWSASISKMISDPEFRKKVGESGRNFVIENYSLEKSQEEFRELFQKVI